MKQIVTNLFDNVAILAKIMKILYNVRQTVSQNKSYLWAKSSQFSHDRTHKLFVVENIKASFDIFFELLVFIPIIQHDQKPSQTSTTST